MESRPLSGPGFFMRRKSAAVLGKLKCSVSSRGVRGFWRRSARQQKACEPNAEPQLLKDGCQHWARNEKRPKLYDRNGREHQDPNRSYCRVRMMVRSFGRSVLI